MFFNEYLKHIGYSAIGRTPEEIAMLRTEYRRFYNRQYSKVYRQKFKRFDVQFTHTENEVIQKVSKIYKVKPATLIHHASIAYLESEVYLPHFEDVKNVEYLIRKSSNNINQLVYSSHRNRAIFRENLNALVLECNSMEKTLNEFYQQPKIIFKPLDLCS